MKRYSLQFKNQKIEQMYQNKSADVQRKSVLKLASGALMLYQTCKLFESIFLEDFLYVILRILVLSYLIIQLLLIKYCKNFSQLGIMATNIIIVIFQISVDHCKSKQMAYLFGQNMMIAQAIMIQSSELTWAIVQVLISTLFRILINVLMQEVDDYVTYSITIGTGILMCVWLSQHTKMQRNQFLMTIKNELLESVIPGIIQHPFILFTFDQESNQFCFKSEQSTNLQLTSSKDLKKYLRTAKCGQKTLEQRIWQTLKHIERQESCSYFEKQDIELKYLKSRPNAKIFIFQLETQNILIQFDQDTLKERLLKKSLEQQKQRHFKYLNILLKKSFYTIHNALVSDNYEKLMKYRLETAKQLLKVQLTTHQSKIERINLIGLFKSAIKMVPRKDWTPHIDKMSDIFIETIKPLLNLVILDVLTCFKTTFLKLQVEENQDYQVSFIIRGDINILKKTKYSLMAEQMNICKIIQTTYKSVLIQIYSESFISFSKQMIL